MSGEKFQSDPGIVLTFVGISDTLNSNKHFASIFAEFQCCFYILILVENNLFYDTWKLERSGVLL